MSLKVFWDEPKRDSNVKDHGFDFGAARDRFDWDTALILPTYPTQSGDKRFIAIGFLDGAVVTLVFSPLGTEAVSLIGLRTASNGERQRYAQD